MDNFLNDSLKSNNNFYEHNFGFTTADLLILEIKKPKRKKIQKNDLMLKINSNRCKNDLYLFDEEKYKDPKVRIKIYNK